MSAIWILTLLKFAGLAIGLATAIWGMTRKTTFDDEAGRKRLTPAGYVALALTLGSFLVAATSQGFEILAKQAEARGKAAQAEIEAAAQFRRDQRAQRTLDLQNLSRAEALSAAAEQRAARAEERLLILDAATEARARDLALSRDVNRGSRENLQRTGTALGQLERLLQPIEAIEVQVNWELPFGDRVPSFVDHVRKIDPNAEPPGLLFRVEENGILKSFGFDQRFAMPERADLLSVIYYAQAQVAIWASEQRPTKARLIAADLGMDVDTSLERGLTYDVATNKLDFVMKLDPRTTVVRSGRIASINDLKNAMVTIRLLEPAPTRRPRQESLKAAMRPYLVMLKASGRSYTVGRTAIRRVEALDGGTPFFVFTLKESDLERLVAE